MARSAQRAARATARRDGRQGVPRPVDPVVARRLPSRVVERPLRRPGAWQMEVQRRAGSRSRPCHSDTRPLLRQTDGARCSMAQASRARSDRPRASATRARPISSIGATCISSRSSCEMHASMLIDQTRRPGSGRAGHLRLEAPSGVGTAGLYGLPSYGRLEPAVQAAHQAARHQRAEQLMRGVITRHHRSDGV